MAFGKNIFKYGLPFLGFVTVGSFGLQYFTQLRLDYRDTAVSRKALSDVGINPDKAITLDQLYEDRVAGKTFDDWKIVPVPKLPLGSEEDFGFKLATRKTRSVKQVDS